MLLQLPDVFLSQVVVVVARCWLGRAGIRTSGVDTDINSVTRTSYGCAGAGCLAIGSMLLGLRF